MFFLACDWPKHVTWSKSKNKRHFRVTLCLCFRTSPGAKPLRGIKVLLSNLGTRLLLCVRGFKRSPKRLYFEENTLKDTPGAPTLECWRLNTLKGTKNSLVTPKRYHKQPPPPRGVGGGGGRRLFRVYSPAWRSVFYPPSLAVSLSPF